MPLRGCEDTYVYDSERQSCSWTKLMKYLVVFLSSLRIVTFWSMYTYYCAWYKLLLRAVLQAVSARFASVYPTVPLYQDVGKTDPSILGCARTTARTGAPVCKCVYGHQDCLLFQKIIPEYLAQAYLSDCTIIITLFLWAFSKNICIIYVWFAKFLCNLIIMLMSAPISNTFSMV